MSLRQNLNRLTLTSTTVQCILNYLEVRLVYSSSSSSSSGPSSWVWLAFSRAISLSRSARAMRLDRDAYRMAKVTTFWVIICASSTQRNSLSSLQDNWGKKETLHQFIQLNQWPLYKWRVIPQLVCEEFSYSLQTSSWAAPAAPSGTDSAHPRLSRSRCSTGSCSGCGKGMNARTAPGGREGDEVNLHFQFTSGKHDKLLTASLSSWISHVSKSSCLRYVWHVYLHLSFLCSHLTQRQLEGQDGHCRSGKSGRVPGAFTWNTPDWTRADWIQDMKKPWGHNYLLPLTTG